MCPLRLSTLIRITPQDLKLFPANPVTHKPELLSLEAIYKLALDVLPKGAVKGLDRNT